jgi:hypothetical protein
MLRGLRGIARVVVALAAGALMAAACGPGDEELPPGTRTQNPAAAAAGYGDAGELPLPRNLCECISTIDPHEMQPGSCFKCFDDIAQVECQAEASECAASVSCSAIIGCVSDCGYEPDCVKDCILPLDKDGGHIAYATMMSCGCAANVCGYYCVYSKPLTCG